MSLDAALARCCCTAFPTTECFASFRQCFGLPLPQTVSISMACQLEFNCTERVEVFEGEFCNITNILLISATMNLTGTLDDPNAPGFDAPLGWPRYTLTGTASRNFYQEQTSDCAFLPSASESYSIAAPSVTGSLTCFRAEGRCLPGSPQFITGLLGISAGIGSGIRTVCADGNCDTQPMSREIFGSIAVNACNTGPLPCSADGFGNVFPNTRGDVGGIDELSAVGFTVPGGESSACPTIYSGSYTITFS